MRQAIFIGRRPTLKGGSLLLRSVISFVLFLVAVPLVAQNITGGVAGVVVDEAHSAVKGAEVKIVSTDQGLTRDVLTNESGQFLLPELPVGIYELTVTAPGFEKYVKKGIHVNVAVNTTADVVLKIGSVDVSVVVNADDSSVDTATAVVGTLIDKKIVQEMPLATNNLVSLAALLPGVSVNSINAPASFTRNSSGPTFNINGARAGQNLFLLDGVYFNNLYRNTGLNYPPQEAVAQVQVLTNNYQAEYGHNAGSVFSVITKSGTNVYHGSIWEYNQNTVYNARNGYPGLSYSASLQNIKLNQAGFGVGGPILHDRLFFEVSYQAYRRPNTQTAQSGVVSGYTNSSTPVTLNAKLNDPASGACAPFVVVGNTTTIPACRFDPAATAIIDAFNLGANGSRTTSFTNPNDNDLGILRLDYNRGKHTIDGRFFAINSSDIVPQGNIYTYDPVADSALVLVTSGSDTYLISTNMLNVARVAYKRFHQLTDPQDHRTLSTFGSNFPVFGSPTLPYISVNGLFNLSAGNNALQDNVEQTFEINDAISWTRRSHNFKFGGNFLVQKYNGLRNNSTQGLFTFSGLKDTSTGSASSYSSEAEFLTGNVTTLQVASPALVQAGEQRNIYLYAQDNWRITNRVTLDLGLRYELPFPWFDPLNQWGTFRINQQSTRFPNAPVGLVFNGDKGIPKGMVATDYNNFAPRVGVSWDVTGKGLTTIRAGFGVFFDALNAGLIQNFDQPFQYSYTFSNPGSLSNPLAGLPSIPTTVPANPTFVGTPTITFPDKDMTTPYVMQANFGIQHTLPRSFIVEANYVGRAGRKLFEPYSYNPGLYAVGATLSNLDSRRRIQGFGDMNDEATIGTSSYNAIQLKVTKKNKMFNVNGSLTWSRSIDTMSSAANEVAIIPQPFKLRTERAPSDFNADLIGTLAYVVTLPSLHRQNVVLRETLGGWQYSGMYQIVTGNPVNVILNADVALSGTPDQRPNQSGSAQMPSKRTRYAKTKAWFNTAVFSAPAAGTFGNAGRNSVIGPAAIWNNMAVQKSWTLPAKGWTINFRADAFGVFNTPNIGNIGVGSLGGSQGENYGGQFFGQSLYYTGNRQLQLVLRVRF